MNIINAIYNLVYNPVISVELSNPGNNRANDVGTAFEEFIKDLFAGSRSMSQTDRLEQIHDVFSYLGNNSNPPDAILRHGDAIEIKKIESDSSIALNSSYPKHTLRSDSPMISSACRASENWTTKDIIYAVGIVRNNTLQHLSMVYGLDYCASEECYSRIKTTIKNGVESIPGVEFAESRELGRINRVDPLGVTYLRVRGMWGIENPWRVFNYVYRRDISKRFTFMCIINEEKWSSFKNTRLITSLSIPGFKIENVRIKNPDNPARLVNAKLITFFLN